MLPRTLEPEVMDTAEEATDYDEMDHSHVNRVFVDDLLAAAKRFDVATPTTEILDVGTGTALIPIEFCRRPEQATVRAIDLAAEMLVVAQRNVANAGLRERIVLELVDAKRLPYPNGSFDWVISNSIIHHIPEPSACFAEMLRVTRSGGLLFVRDLLRPDTAEAVEHIVETYARQDSARQQQLFRQSLHAALTLEELRELIARFGLPAEAVQQTSDRHWTLAARA